MKILLEEGRKEWLRRNVKQVAEGFSGDPRTSKASKSTVRAPIRVNQTQSADDQNALEVRDRKIMPNLYHVEVDDRRWVHGLAFDGQNLLVPYHAVHGKAYVNIRLHGRDSLKPIEFQLIPENVYRFKDMDLAVIRSIKRLPPAPRISKYFIRERDLADYKKFNGELLAKVRGSPMYEASYTGIQDLNYMEEVQRMHSFDTELIFVREGWKHDVPTRLGYCGAPLIAHGKKFCRKIVGIHVSGIDNGKSGGIATLVTEEMLHMSLEGGHGFEDLNQTQNFEAVTNDSESTMIDEGYVCYGRLPPGEGEFAATKTAIRKSRIHEKVGPATTAPAVLSTYDERNVHRISPFRRALLKYTRRTRPFDRRDIEMVSEHIHNIHIDKVKPLKDVSEMSEFMMVNGDPFIDEYKQIEMDSSPGYPWKKKRPAGEKGKRFCFRELEDYEYMKAYLMREDLKEEVCDILTDLQNGKRPRNVWVHCLKDERRPLAKVRDVKTRIFTMAPVSWTLAIRALTMHFTAAFYAAHLNFYSAVGSDPYSPEWTKLFRRLREVGRKAGDGDYGQYDGTLDPDLMYEALHLMCKWYVHHLKGRPLKIVIGSRLFEFTAEQLEKAYEIMATDFVHTVQLVFDILHQKCQGNPSGNPLTVLVNTIVGAFYLMLCFIGLYQRWDKVDKPYMNMDSYEKYVRDAIYGDDNAFTAATAVEDFFNPRAIGEYLAEYGIEYTTADKSGIQTEWKDIDELRFLKNGFGSHPIYPSMKMATMENDTIVELTNWQRESADDDEQLRVQCDNALRFAYFHGKEYHNNLLNKINEALRDEGIRGFASDFYMKDLDFTKKFWT
jgi:hypothetical protein